MATERYSRRSRHLFRRLVFEPVEQRRLLATVLDASFNAQLEDPADLPKGPQPTSWRQQRSDLRSIDVRFSAPIQEVEVADLVLTLDSNDQGIVVPLAQTQLVTQANTLTIAFAPRELVDGLYSLEILPTVREPDGTILDGDGDGEGGDSYRLHGDVDNGFFKLTADWNGEGGVSIFDFPTFAYWFGRPTTRAPEYVDLNQDGGVSIHDFPPFAVNFGRAVGDANCSTFEAQRLAIEVSGDLTAPASLTRRICNDLEAIRSEFPEVASITHRPAWQNQVLVRLTDEAFEQFERGEYHDLDSLNQQYAATEMTRSGDSWAVISFSRVYDIQQLSQFYARVDSVESAQPVNLFGDGDDIIARLPTYEFIRGFGDCPSGCIFREGWTFSVEQGAVTLGSHWITDPLPIL